MLLVLFVSTASAQSYVLDTIHMTGPCEKRMNFVFVSDGFVDSEMVAYRAGVKSIANQLFSTTPYKEYRNYINIFAIEVPSAESGANHPGTAYDEPTPPIPVTKVNNIFGSVFDASNIHRLLVAFDEAGIKSIVFDNYPLSDQIFVLVNSSVYGGSGGALATASMNGASAEVAIHEIGHSLAGLGDEYGSGTPYPGSEKPNTTAQTKRDSIKWNRWILPTTPIPTPDSIATAIGLFEGASYNDHGWYRPRANCKMRSLGVSFCSVCAEAITLKIQKTVSPLDAFTPPTAPLTIGAKDSIRFGLSLLHPIPNSLAVQWAIDSTILPSTSDTIVLNAYSFPFHDNILTATIRDTTKLVRPLLGSSGPEIKVYQVSWSLVRLPGGVNVSAEQNTFGFTAAVDPSDGNIAATLSLTRQEHVTLTLVDMGGRELSSLYDGEVRPGSTQLRLPVRGLSSGAYAVQCKAGNVMVGKLILVQH